MPVFAGLNKFIYNNVYATVNNTILYNKIKQSNNNNNNNI